MQLILKRKQFATYGVNNNFTSVSYSPGSIQANPAATTMTSTGKSYRPPRSLDSYATTNSPKAIRPHVVPVKASSLDPTLPPSRWAGRITPYNRDGFTPNPNIGTVKNSPLRPLGAPKYHPHLEKIPLGNGKVLARTSNPLPPVKYAPSRGERMVNMVKGIGRNIGGLFTGK